MFTTGDVVFFQAPNCQFLACDAQQRVVANAGDPAGAAQFSVETSTQGILFKRGAQYLRVDPATKIVMVTAASSAEATPFTVLGDQHGSLHLDTLDAGYLELSYSDGLIRQGKDEVHMLTTSFDMGFVSTAHPPSVVSAKTIDDCEMAWAMLAYQLTVGFFLAIGLGPFFASGRVAPGVMALLRANSRVWGAIQAAVRTILAQKTIAIPALLTLIGLCWKEGLLWPILKLVLQVAKWYVIARAIAKIIEIVLIPEVEAADLLASFAIWQYQTIQAAFDIGNKCKTASAPDLRIA
jgi:hypothetical protein